MARWCSEQGGLWQRFDCILQSRGTNCRLQEIHALLTKFNLLGHRNYILWTSSTPMDWNYPQQAHVRRYHRHEYTIVYMSLCPVKSWASELSNSIWHAYMGMSYTVGKLSIWVIGGNYQNSCTPDFGLAAPLKPSFFSNMPLWGINTRTKFDLRFLISLTQQ